MIFVQSNNLGFVKPRNSVTAETQEANSAYPETPANYKPTSLTTEEADSFTTTTPPTTEANEPEEIATKTPAKSKTSVLEKRQRIKALEATEKQQAKQEQADAEEIHKAKVSSAWKSFIPFIGIFPLLGAVFSSPQQLAKDRGDVKFKDRDIDEATEQEKKLKASKIKASLAVQVPLWIGGIIGIIGMVSLLKNKTQDFKFGVVNFLPYLCYIPALAVPLGYKFGEKPDDPNFNKAL